MRGKSKIDHYIQLFNKNRHLPVNHDTYGPNNEGDNIDITFPHVTHVVILCFHTLFT